MNCVFLIQAQEDWAEEKAALNTRLEDQLTLSEDERLCFIKELDRLSREVRCLFPLFLMPINILIAES